MCVWLNNRNLAAAALMAVALTACSGGSDEHIYAISMAEAKSKISRVQSQYNTGSTTRTMRASGVSEKGIPVQLSNAGIFSSSCHIQFEQVDADTTRITPDCGETGAATSDVAAQFFELEIAAHVRHILTGEDIDTDELGKQMAALTLKNIGSIAKEGGQVDPEWVEQQKKAAINKAEKTQDGWGDDASGQDW